MFPVIAAAGLALQAYSAYQQGEAQKKAAKNAQSAMPMFGAPRLAPGVYQAAQARAPAPQMPDVGPDMAAMQAAPPQFDAAAMMREMIAGGGRG